MTNRSDPFLPILTPAGWSEDRYPLDPVRLDLSLPDLRVALVGARGSGKSTLLRHLATKGNVLVLDDTTPEAAAELAEANPRRRIFASAGGAIPGFVSRELLPFSESDVRVYLNGRVPRRMAHQILAHKDLATLAQTPAVVARMAAMCDAGASFPGQRAELYEWILTQLGPVAHPAIGEYRVAASAAQPPGTRERFCLYGAIRYRTGGLDAVEQLATAMLAAVDGSLAARTGAVARVHALATDLNLRLHTPQYLESVLAMTALFADTPDAAEVPLDDKLTAAEALAQLGDPRLRLPSDADYWAPVGQGIQLGRFPVTVQEFESFVAATGYVPFAWEEQLNRRSRPVTGVGWHTAVAYCRWAGGHLPSAAEWESALAGKYPWGDGDPTKLHANTNELQLGHPTPVGLFPRGNTPHSGIADLYGNVFEWVDEDVTRPGEIEMRATRGGSSRTSLSRPNGRWDTLESGHENIGFRCARRR